MLIKKFQLVGGSEGSGELKNKFLNKCILEGIWQKSRKNRLKNKKNKNVKEKNRTHDLYYLYKGGIEK